MHKVIAEYTSGDKREIGRWVVFQTKDYDTARNVLKGLIEGSQPELFEWAARVGNVMGAANIDFRMVR